MTFRFCQFEDYKSIYPGEYHRHFLRREVDWRGFYYRGCRLQLDFQKVLSQFVDQKSAKEFIIELYQILKSKQKPLS